MERKNWIKEIAEKASQYHNGRKIVSWGYFAPSFDIDITLRELYGLEIAFYVDGDDSLVDNVHVFLPEILSEASSLYYVVIPLSFYPSIKDRLTQWGYQDTDYYYFSDCVIENSPKRYLDKHGNEIINPPRNVKCTFWGYNNKVEFPETPGFYSKMNIIAGSDNKIKIESKEIRNTDIFMWEDNSFLLEIGSALYDSRFCLMSKNIFTMGIKCRITNSELRIQYESNMHMANNSIYEGNVQLTYSSIINIGEDSKIACHFTGHPKTRFSIGRNVTTVGFYEEQPAFRQKNTFITAEGTKIIIGDECVFSINIKLICGDGHTIFDTETGKNLNSAPEMIHSIIVHKHVWIGANVVLLDGTEIGADSVVGAGSIVNKEFPENCIIAGNPAKVIHKNRTWDWLWKLEKMPSKVE